MELLFLDLRPRVQPIVDYARSKGYGVHVYDGKELTFMPDYIINGKDNKAGLEYDLIQQYSPFTYFDSDARDFFLYKSVQDRICSEINVPVIPNVSPKVIVKVDRGQSGGEGAYICDRSEAGEGFIQDYMEIDHVISAHIYADDEGEWHIYSYGKMEYIDNKPSAWVGPYFPTTNHIESCVKKLNGRLDIRNRIFFWQFLNGYYHMDFNCRPSGGFDKRIFDLEIGDCDIVECLIERTIPNEIRYHTRIRFDYIERPQFGYGTSRRSSIPIVDVETDRGIKHTATREETGSTDS